MYVSLAPIHLIMRLVINCLLSISYSDSSKQQTRLRAKLTVSKAEVKDDINGLKVLHPKEEIDVEAIEQGTFPWLDRSGQGKETRVLPLVVVILFIIIVVINVFISKFSISAAACANNYCRRELDTYPICTSIRHLEMGSLLLFSHCLNKQFNIPFDAINFS